MGPGASEIIGPDPFLIQVGLAVGATAGVTGTGTSEREVKDLRRTGTTCW